MSAFPDIQKIRFEGPKSKNPLAFRHYDENEVVAGKTMKDHLRFSVAYWHTMRGTGGDPFGPGTMLRPWEGGDDSVDNAINRVRVAFEFMEKLGAPFFCFHDRDVAPEGSHAGRDQQEPRRGGEGRSRKSMQRTGIKLLWGTANLFSNPRYVHGAATSCQRRRLRLRRRPGEEGPGSDQGTGRRRATRSGAAAKATRPSGTPT